MTLRREILDALEDEPRGLCDACLKRGLNASYHQHVRAICALLETEGRLLRNKLHSVECPGCGNVRIINRLIRSSPVMGGSRVPASAPIIDSFGINDLDALRREIIQFLSAIDPSSAREGFSKRVTMLRSNGAIPSRIASLMLTHAAYRNDLYYNAHVLTPEESGILKAIDKCLRSYIQSYPSTSQASN